MGKKIILYIAMSLDGFIARKNGSVDWLDKFNKSGEDYGYDTFICTVDTVVLGNTTYKQFKAPYPNKECYVFAHKEGKEDNVTFVSGDVKEFVDSLDKEKEHNIFLVGGANLVNQFMKYDLINEFSIFIIPILLGEGIRLFDEYNNESQLIFEKSKSHNSGVVELHYKRP
jgi:dihydrofolate reductase